MPSPRFVSGSVLIHRRAAGGVQAREALVLIDVRALDHLAVAGPMVIPFAESGLL